MTPRCRRLPHVLLAGALALAGCSSDSSSSSDSQPVSSETSTSAPAATPAPTDESDPSGGTTPSTADEPDGGTVVGDTTTTNPTTTGPDATTSASDEPASPAPDEVDELVLTDDLGSDGDSWDEGGSWEVDVPGESSATVIDGVGVMETDLRGTHEWVRALAEETLHEDATLFATITPLDSDEGTVFVGLRGDGEWRDNFQYLPQTGVVLEYAYSPVFAGEIVIVVLDGAELRRVGPVEGPVLVDGESAEIRFEVDGDRARAKVWRAGDDEPTAWQIEAETASSEPGVVQISYRDGVARSVAWDELRLVVQPGVD